MNFKQLNHIPYVNGAFLDLTLSNDTFYKVCKFLVPFALNDITHKPFEISFNFSLKINALSNHYLGSRTRHNFMKADIDKLSNFLININWEDEFSGSDDINTNLDKFCEILFQRFDQYIPVTKITPNTHKLWYNDVLINKKKRKDKAYKRMKLPNETGNFSVIKRKPKDIRQLCI